eukprot:CAMPEP_0175142908 /NCGR_PEP_ID=MMETSP0087-20121206/13097_1 /TAXON_ID=136419 /ORGANISM="Unknown Unknown, Strain D1" /LENGTH=433 /DNA_ID=CAMNT_0016426837 /DNA_START=209 /DNA_END=1510 /DNA_ORIENTATION=+
MQTIEGFGGAFTDSVAQVFAQLNSTLQEQVLEMMWGQTGQKYNMARLTIGATDFSTTEYSYANSPNDFKMQNFSLQHDMKNIIPMIHRAQAKATSGGDLKFLATPWSPPAWMKRNKFMRNSDSPGLIQDSQIFQAYALYLSKYIDGMAAQNISVSKLTVQNEPHVKGQFAATYPCCGFNATQEMLFVRDYLGPLLRQQHPDTKLFVHDDQKDIMVDYVSTIMADPTASKFVDGVAFHWYGANLKNYQYLEQLHKKFPSLPLLATEATLEAPFNQHLGTSPWKEAQKYAVDIMGDLNAFTTGWIEWNVLLDKQGGPTCIGPSNSNICTPLIGYCDAPILADTDKQTLEIRDSYYIMGHFSRFIPRGSKVIKQTGATDTNASLLATAVLTPGQEIVVVVVNTDQKASAPYQISCQGQYAVIEIPPHSIQTLSFKA